jgi:hypothetical protein
MPRTTDGDIRTPRPNGFLMATDAVMALFP